jgi:hypothetical protein
MARITLSPIGPRTPRHQVLRLRNRLFWTCLLLILGIDAPRLTPNAGAGSPTFAAAGPGLPFAIADFDGDQHLDLASIQSGQNNSSSTSAYWVQVRLTGSGRSSFRLSAPKGGLLIEARDVNGDHAVDLILSTAWLRKPVAILLNDGHGSFLPVAPTAFPDAFRKSNSNWNGSVSHLFKTVPISREFRIDLCAQASRAASAQPDSTSVYPSDVKFASAYLLAACAGRAPPADLLST